MKVPEWLRDWLKGLWVEIQKPSWAAELIPTVGSTATSVGAIIVAYQILKRQLRHDRQLLKEEREADSRRERARRFGAELQAGLDGLGKLSASTIMAYIAADELPAELTRIQSALHSSSILAPDLVKFARTNYDELEDSWHVISDELTGSPYSGADRDLVTAVRKVLYYPEQHLRSIAGAYLDWDGAGTRPQAQTFDTVYETLDLTMSPGRLNYLAVQMRKTLQIRHMSFGASGGGTE